MPATNSQKHRPCLWVCHAVRQRRLVRIIYRGRQRLVRAALHGYSPAGDELLLGAQQDPDGSRTEWKTYRVDRIESLVVLDVALLLITRDRRAGLPIGFAEVHCAMPGIATVD